MLPISSIDSLMDINGQIVEPNTIRAIQLQVDDFIIWTRKMQQEDKIISNEVFVPVV